MHAAARRAAPLISIVLAGTLLAGCGGGTTATSRASGATAGQPTGGSVTDLTKLCALVGPGDFASVGIEGAGSVTVSSDGPGSAYCVFKGTSGATGGIEFDAFVDDDPKGVFDTIVSEAKGALGKLPIPGVDDAVGTDGTAGQADGYATIVVRKGNFVFTIAVPGGPGLQAKLTALAAIVIGRAAGLIG